MFMRKISGPMYAYNSKLRRFRIKMRAGPTLISLSKGHLRVWVFTQGCEVSSRQNT